MSRLCATALVVLLTAFVAPEFRGLSADEEAPGELEQRDARYAADLARKTLPTLSLTSGGTPLARPEASLLRWSNPTAGRGYGNVFL